MSRNAELSIEEKSKDMVEPALDSGEFSDDDETSETDAVALALNQAREPFSEQKFTAAFYAAASCDDAEALGTVGAMFNKNPKEAWTTIDKICDEKAKEATRATQTGNYTAAAAAIEAHHSLAMVYSKLISARIEQLNASF